MIGIDALDVVRDGEGQAERRFWGMVSVGGVDECWPWLARRDRDGYGRFKFMGKSLYAHRTAYQMLWGALAPGMFVCHRCDQPSCCNPSHLFAGTHVENMADMVVKGRACNRSGERNTQAKLTSADVLGIRRLLSQGKTHASVAKELGVCKSAISNIASGRSWVSEVIHGDA